MGRISTYNEDQANQIAERLSDGEPLRQICRDPNMPQWRTVYDWIAAHPDFAARIARARELGQDVIAEDCLAIADDLTDEPASRRVRVETRLKLLAKWNPKRYGDRVELAGDKNAPLTIEVIRFGQ